MKGVRKFVLLSLMQKQMDSTPQTNFGFLVAENSTLANLLGTNPSEATDMYVKLSNGQVPSIYGLVTTLFPTTPSMSIVYLGPLSSTPTESSIRLSSLALLNTIDSSLRGVNQGILSRPTVFVLECTKVTSVSFLSTQMRWLSIGKAISKLTKPSTTT